MDKVKAMEEKTVKQLKAVHHDIRSKVRKAVTGDENMRVRTHIGSQIKDLQRTAYVAPSPLLFILVCTLVTTFVKLCAFIFLYHLSVLVFAVK